MDSYLGWRKVLTTMIELASFLMMCVLESPQMCFSGACGNVWLKILKFACQLSHIFWLDLTVNYLLKTKWKSWVVIVI